jgi:hypothetical protein
MAAIPYFKNAGEVSGFAFGALLLTTPAGKHPAPESRNKNQGFFRGGDQLPGLSTGLSSALRVQAPGKPDRRGGRGNLRDKSGINHGRPARSGKELTHILTGIQHHI